MSIRAHYAPWGSGLADADFTAALAALGCCDVIDNDDAQAIADRLFELMRLGRWGRYAEIRWRYLPPAAVHGRAQVRDAGKLAAAWRTFETRLGAQPRLRIEQAPDHLLPELQELFDRAGLAVWFAEERPEELNLDWPLDIGLLDDPLSLRLRETLEGNGWFGKLFRLSNARAGESSTLLVLPQDLVSVTKRFAADTRRVDTGAVLVMGGLGSVGRADVAGAARFVQNATTSGGIAIFEGGAPPAPAPPIVELIRYMSHGDPFDVAIGKSAKKFGASSYMVFDPRVVRSLSAPRLAIRAGRILRDQGRIREAMLGDEPRIDRPEGVRRMTVEAHPTLSGLGQTLEASAGDETIWMQEIDAATDASILVKAAAAAQPEAPAPRYLQCNIAEPLATGDPVRDARLLEDHAYVAAVRIGYPDIRYLADHKPIEIPPNEEEPHRVDIWFFEPDCAPVPLIQSLEVPPVGNSKDCIFPFRTTAAPGLFAARIIVIHRGCILQAGELRAEIGGAGATATPEFKLDVLAKMSLDDLGATRVFDATLFLQRGADGATYALLPNARTVRVQDSTLAAFTQVVAGFLTNIRNDPVAYDSLISAATQTLLRGLAQHGSALFKVLRRQAPPSWFDIRDGRMSIGSAPDAYFPAEFVYQDEAPDDYATLCAGHREALETGKCCGECTQKPGRVICPLSFWSLSRIIERQSAFGEGVPDPAHGEYKLMLRGLQPTAPIDPLTCGLLGASDRASAHDPDVLKHVTENTQAAFREPWSGPAKDWQQWKDAVRDNQPSALVLLPHHESARGFEYLQLGPEVAGDHDGQPGYLKSVHVKSEHVSAGAQAPSPMVLLIGCETQAARIGFENFVSAFRAAGAAAVIGTVATVLGRHSGPVAEALLAETHAHMDKGKTIGDVVLATKRKMLLKGVPMVMGLTTYGGADRPLAKL